MGDLGFGTWVSYSEGCEEPVRWFKKVVVSCCFLRGKEDTLVRAGKFCLIFSRAVGGPSHDGEARQARITDSGRFSMGSMRRGGGGESLQWIVDEPSPPIAYQVFGGGRNVFGENNP